MTARGATNPPVFHRASGGPASGLQHSFVSASLTLLPNPRRFTSGNNSSSVNDPLEWAPAFQWNGARIQVSIQISPGLQAFFPPRIRINLRGGTGRFLAFCKESKNADSIFSYLLGRDRIPSNFILDEFSILKI